MNLAALLDRAGRGFADRPALALGEAVLCDHRTLAGRAAVLAGNLRGRLGLAPGDRVALVMRNSPEYVELLFACWHAGLTAVPVNAKLAAAEFRYILDHSGARACFVTPDLAPVVGGLTGPETVIEVGGAAWRRLGAGDGVAMAETAADDVAWLFYTSGTTGRPKGAMLTHRNGAISPTSIRSRPAIRSCMRRRCRTARASIPCRTWRRGRCRSSPNPAVSSRTRCSACSPRMRA
jgi:acyl-CoA synthetase (AMP-forming)/AMP-acid ligase II